LANASLASELSRRGNRYDGWVPLRNRVTPFGGIVATPERGTMMGNRGILHDDCREIVRTTQVRRWICCVLSFKGIRRVVMRPRSYTELFFLDEATALAAGHRPCFECRRSAALAFQSAWAQALGGCATADEMDRVLEAERRVPRTGLKRTYEAEARSLPDGAVIALEGRAWLVLHGRLLRWTPAGYADAAPLASETVDVLTPRSTTEVLRAGYAPGIHVSAGSRSSPDAPTRAKIT
jgi:hypothetical protein